MPRGRSAGVAAERGQRVALSSGSAGTPSGRRPSPGWRGPSVLVRTEQDPALLDRASGWAAWAARGRGAVARCQAPADGPELGIPYGPEPGSGDELLADERVAALSGPGGLGEQTQLVCRAASSVREFSSSTTWEVLESLVVDPARPAESLDRVVVALQRGAAGLAMESTVRGPSWWLLDLGRRVEPALVLLGVVESMLGPEPNLLTVAAMRPGGADRPREPRRLPAALPERRPRRGRARPAGRRRHQSTRALAFQLDRMAEHLVALPGAAGAIAPGGPARHLGADGDAGLVARSRDLGGRSCCRWTVAGRRPCSSSTPAARCWTWPTRSWPAGSPTPRRPGAWDGRCDPVPHRAPHDLSLCVEGDKTSHHDARLAPRASEQQKVHAFEARGHEPAPGKNSDPPPAGLLRQIRNLVFSR